LFLISNKLKEKNLGEICKDTDVFDITQAFKNCKSKIIQKALKEKAVIKVIRIKKFSGMFGYSPYEGIRLGKEIGQLVRFFGIGGIFHSDELPNYGIENSDIEEVKKIIEADSDDAFLIIAVHKSKMDFAIQSIINRIKDAVKGVPAETRLATQTGETLYLRPRPGASRMYPETDIPPLLVSKNELESAKNNIPKSWDESLAEIEKQFKINHQLSEQVYDSDRYETIATCCTDYPNVPASFIASTLTSTITDLERRTGKKSSLLKDSHIKKTMQLLSEEKISKESVEMIFENIMSEKEDSVENVIQKLSIGNIDETELNEKLNEIIEQNSELIMKQGKRSIGPLMGIAMKVLRGKADGEVINKLLEEKIKSTLNNKN